MPTRPALLAILLTAVTGLLGTAAPVTAMPEGINYQGELYVGGAPFDGSADLKAAIVESGVTYWSNDGTSTTGDEPAASFPVSVTTGIFSVKLGDGTPTPLMAPSDFNGMGTNPVLRLWVDTGSGFEQLPDQPLANSLFALSADAAHRAAGDFTVEGELHLSPQGVRFDDGSVLTTAAGTGGDSLWTQDNDDIYRLGGKVGIGTWAPTKTLHVGGEGRFSWVDHWVDISTPGGWPGFIAKTQGGKRRDIIFDDTGVRVLASPDTNPPASNNGIILDDLGRVGVGQVPITPLDVKGSILAERLELRETQFGDTEAALITTASTGGGLWLYNETAGVTLAGYGGASGSNLQMYNGTPSHGPTIALDANVGGGGEIRLRNGSNVESFTLNGQAFSNSSQMRFYGGNGLSVEITGGANEIKLFDDTGANSVWLTGSDGNDDGRVRADVVEITGGSDLSERFDIDDGGTPVEPGMVVSIDPRNPGSLVVSDAPYQKTAAGIVSGAGGVKTGMLMGQEGSIADGRHAVALTGRVWAWCDASRSPIEPGDMLTTSSVPGHAMAVSDPGRAYGAVIGKAMTALESGRGLVLVLVGLQ